MQQLQNELEKLRRDILIAKTKAFDLIEEANNQKAQAINAMENWQGIVKTIGSILGMGNEFSIEDLIEKVKDMANSNIEADIEEKPKKVTKKKVTKK